VSQLPLCSSEQVVAALKRLGFQRTQKTKGSSHQPYWRARENRKYVVVVVLGKKEIPRGTLKAILIQAGLSEAEFLTALK
jgi:predicted RNA binding protein YcfA (HicA-like mRNA interferase family)